MIIAIIISTKIAGTSVKKILVQIAIFISVVFIPIDLNIAKSPLKAFSDLLKHKYKNKLTIKTVIIHNNINSMLSIYPIATFSLGL